MKYLRIALIVLMLACMLVLTPSGAIVAQAEVIELGLTDKKGLPPQKDCYLSDREYVDPSISVKIESGRVDETNYLVARVKIANASQIRSAMAQTYSNPSKVFGASMAKRANAVFAVNGDYFSARMNVGYVARQGKVYRTKCDGRYDVLIIDDKGDLHIFKNATNDAIAAFDGVVVNGYTFGPGLVIDSVAQTGYQDMDNAALKPAQRMCIAQVGELEYLCICSEGPEDPGSVGLTLEQFTQLVASFEGVQNAYNLDGGSSSTMVFQNQKINSPKNPKKRELCDILYFASAYQP